MPPGHGFSTLEEVILGLRSEHITHVPPSEDDLSHRHTPSCHVVVTEPAGPDILAQIRIGDIEAMARPGAETSIGSGTTARLMVDMTTACLFDPETGHRIGD